MAAMDNCFDALSNPISPLPSSSFSLPFLFLFASATSLKLSTLPFPSTSAGRITLPSNTLRTMLSICGPNPPTAERKSDRKASFRCFPCRVLDCPAILAILLLLVLVLLLPLTSLDSEALPSRRKSNIRSGFHPRRCNVMSPFCTVLSTLFPFPFFPSPIPLPLTPTETLGRSTHSKIMAGPISTASYRRGVPPYCVQVGMIWEGVVFRSVRSPVLLPVIMVGVS
mmetsp:Transcript_3540/g.7520  ORF Transcript_3540/g.7520 Transcript_3540/m.7520 type:complete len:225 (-) Transcript_3540:1088-1762(-)